MASNTNHEPLYTRLGRRLRRARIEAGLSQGLLAWEVGMTRASIANIEQGHQRVPLHVLAALARALGIKQTDLLDGAPEPRAPVRGRGGVEGTRRPRKKKRSGGALY